jgi:hypothetical protein
MRTHPCVSRFTGHWDWKRRSFYQNSTILSNSSMVPAKKRKIDMKLKTKLLYDSEDDDWHLYNNYESTMNSWKNKANKIYTTKCIYMKILVYFVKSQSKIVYNIVIVITLWFRVKIIVETKNLESTHDITVISTSHYVYTGSTFLPRVVR